ncbi:hypothetical protein [Pedobacter africanus]|uniref:Uncharacterized protein n=1 Tax=Pedobacter africanus TaxID=151894 RepID=A0A1W1YS31_9SPHI|nr:hypothetical protein [Pedobacter africanus]SMC38631.1 hypothetical protein SAMN04488524_0140 [Pedobacter africanus]
MSKKLLKRYFEKQCSAAESQAVEEWILDSNNRADFENFLVNEWDGHVDQHLRDDETVMKSSGTFKWWAAAAAAIAVVVGFYHYSSGPEKTERTTVTAAVSQPGQVDTSAGKAQTHIFHSGINTKTITSYERKTIRNKPAQTLAKIDTVNLEKKPLFVKATKLENFMVNKVALRKLINDIDSNKVVLLNLDVHDITFQRLAVLLREECGVVLEPCAGTGVAGISKTYTARFEAISLPDLLNDMSEKMMFSYSVKDNKVKICFN